MGRCLAITGRQRPAAGTHRRVNRPQCLDAVPVTSRPLRTRPHDPPVHDVREEAHDRGAPTVVQHHEARRFEQSADAMLDVGVPMRGWTIGSRMFTSALPANSPWINPKPAPTDTT